MKRRNYRAVVTDASGDRIIGEADTFAWNSAIKASESIVREYARERLTTCHGDAPVVLESDQSGPEIGTGGRIYRRVWREASGREVRALVWEVA